jgi:hypothetical protein
MSRLARLATLSLTTFLLAGAALPAQAQDKSRARPKPAPVDEKSARVDEALRLSGMSVQLGAVRGRLKKVIDDDPRVDYDVRRWVAGMLDASFSPEAYSKPVRQALLDNYDADAMARVLAWYRTPTARKLVRLEQRMGDKAQAAAQNKYLATLEDKQPSEERLVLVFRIDEGTRASEEAMAALKTAANGWNLGIQQVMSEPGRERVQQIERVLSVYRAQLRDVMSEDILREMMYVYREATDAELRSYAEFLESDAGKWFFGTVFKGQEAFLEKATDKVAQDYVNSIEQKQTTRPPPKSSAADKPPMLQPAPAGPAKPASPAPAPVPPAKK